MIWRSGFFGGTLEKQDLRLHFRNQRKAFSQSVESKLRLNISSYLIQVIRKYVKAHKLPLATGMNWASYRSSRSELDLRPIELAVGQFQQVLWCYPRVTGEAMEFRVPTKKESWELNGWGIEEPKLDESQVMPLERISGIFIPGVAFDRTGTRLGSGKGYYDRSLQSYTGLKVGIGYSVQISETDLPHEAHDIKMDILVTEKDVICVNERTRKWMEC